jgi:hypothetical protein
MIRLRHTWLLEQDIMTFYGFCTSAIPRYNRGKKRDLHSRKYRERDITASCKYCWTMELKRT